MPTVLLIRPVCAGMPCPLHIAHAAVCTICVPGSPSTLQSVGGGAGTAHAVPGSHILGNAGHAGPLSNQQYNQQYAQPVPLQPGGQVQHQQPHSDGGMQGEEHHSQDFLDMCGVFLDPEEPPPPQLQQPAGVAADIPRSINPFSQPPPSDPASVPLISRPPVPAPPQPYPQPSNSHLPSNPQQQGAAYPQWPAPLLQQQQQQHPHGVVGGAPRAGPPMPGGGNQPGYAPHSAVPPQGPLPLYSQPAALPIGTRPQHPMHPQSQPQPLPPQPMQPVQPTLPAQTTQAQLRQPFSGTTYAEFEAMDPVTRRQWYWQVCAVLGFAKQCPRLAQETLLVLPLSCPASTPHALVLPCLHSSRPCLALPPLHCCP